MANGSPDNPKPKAYEFDVDVKSAFMAPIFLKVKSPMDVMKVIKAYALKMQIGLIILSAIGSVQNVLLPKTTKKYFNEGVYPITSLSGRIVPCNGGFLGGINIIISNHLGAMVGGAVDSFVAYTTVEDFLFGKISHLSNEQPTINDWENHIGTIWPEVRLKRYLEMRGADGGPWRMLCALPAFWVGLLYDEESLQTVIDMILDWTPEEREMLRIQVPITGLKTVFRGVPLKHVAKDVLKLAKDGLELRGYNDTGFLNVIADVARTGIAPAEKLLELYNGDWGQSIDPVFQGLRY